jgi:hypothetical protein
VQPHGHDVRLTIREGTIVAISGGQQNGRT